MDDTPKLAGNGRDGNVAACACDAKLALCRRGVSVLKRVSDPRLRRVGVPLYAEIEEAEMHKESHSYIAC